MTERQQRIITMLRENNEALSDIDDLCIEAQTNLTDAQKAFDKVLGQRSLCIAQISILIKELARDAEAK